MENLEKAKPVKRYLNDEFLDFRGSESYCKHSDVFSKFFLTYWVKHIADKCGMHWFLDTILSYQGIREVKAIKFQIWTLERIILGEKTGQWRVVLYIDNLPFIKQVFSTISLVDGYEEKFDVFKIYLTNNILFLPSEN